MKLVEAQGREIPALCSNCGYIFNTHTGYFPKQIIEILGKLYEIENGKSHIIGIEGYSNCPICNSKANFRTDLFDIVKETFEELKALGLPEIFKIKKILEEGKQKNVSEETYEQLKDKIKTIYDFKIFEMFGIKTIGDVVGIISLFLAILSLVQNSIEKKENLRDEYIYNIVLQQNLKYIENNSTSVKIPMNRPCICGSKKKYKHCCGKIKK